MTTFSSNCEHENLSSTDLFGFHRITDLDLKDKVEFELADMSMSTCLAHCVHYRDVYVALALNTTCICARTGTTFANPKFKIKHVKSGRFLAVDEESVALKDSGDYWYKWIHCHILSNYTFLP